MRGKLGLTNRRRVRYWLPLSYGRPAWERLIAQVGRVKLSLVSLPAGGWIASAIQHRAGDDWVKLAVPDLEELGVKKIKVGAPVEGATAVHLAPVESVVLGKFQALVSHCCVVRYDDGETRQPGWWTVKTLGSSWVVQVKDPDACASLQAIGATLDDALTLAELLLSSEQAPWEHDRFLAQSKATKRK